MKADNKSDYTINFTRKALTYLSKHTSLAEPEAVKMFIATLKVSDSYKKNLCIAYNRYCKHYKIEWNMPRYTQEAKNVALPTREKLLMLISNAVKLLSMKLQLSMETGLRPVELSRLKVKDIDLDHKTVNPTTAKRGNPRTLPMTANLTTKIQEHIIRKKPKPKRQTFQRTGPRPLRKTIPDDEKQISQKTKKKPINTHNQTIRLQTLLLHKETMRHQQPIHSNGTNGPQKTRNHTEIHAPTKPQ